MREQGYFSVGGGCVLVLVLVASFLVWGRDHLANKLRGGGGGLVFFPPITALVLRVLVL